MNDRLCEWLFSQFEVTWNCSYWNEKEVWYRFYWLMEVLIGIIKFSISDNKMANAQGWSGKQVSLKIFIYDELFEWIKAVHEKEIWFEEFI